MLKKVSIILFSFQHENKLHHLKDASKEPTKFGKNYKTRDYSDKICYNDCL